MIWVIAIVTMAVGAILGLTQTDVKRMLAYSSIAHAGFLLVGLISLDQAGLSGTMFYLLTYGFTTIGAFARGDAGAGRGRRGHPPVPVVRPGQAVPAAGRRLHLFLLALAGIPLTSGFTGKFVVFRAGYTVAAPLVVIALVASAVAAFFYLRIVVLMFFSEPAEDGPTIAMPSALTITALAVGVAATLVLGLVPQPLLDLADRAALFAG